MDDIKTFVATLENFLQAVNKTAGVFLREIGAGRELFVRTENSEYYIYIIDPEEGKVRVRGGKHFPEPTECVFNGSTFGGSMLKTKWVGTGMCLEFFKDGRYITTTFVQSIGLVTGTPPSNSVH